MLKIDKPTSLTLATLQCNMFMQFKDTMTQTKKNLQKNLLITSVDSHRGAPLA